MEFMFCFDNYFMDDFELIYQFCFYEYKICGLFKGIIEMMILGNMLGIFL